MHTILATLTAAVALIGMAGDQTEKAPPIRVLIVTGVDHPSHHWQETAPALRDVLEHDGRFDVDIVPDPEALADDEIFQYDELLLHFKNYKPLTRGEKAKKNLIQFVRSGKGLVILHFACGAFEDWPEFHNLAGKVWDQKTSHDPRGPFTVHIANTKHPVTRGLQDFQTDDELYICLVGERPVEVLATARSKKTGKDHPMAFVFQYGRGRVFHTSLGHDVKAIRMPGVAELIRRGSAWAAGRDP